MASRAPPCKAAGSDRRGRCSPAAGDTNGWYIWFGEEISTAPDFFGPLHASHVYEQYPNSACLLGLAPGYRLILYGSYLDVWYDPTLLSI